MSKISSTLNFVSHFFRKPLRTGSLVPSSKYLAQAIVANFDLNQGRPIIEIGPGTGALTEWLLKRLNNSQDYTAIELNPDFVKDLRERFGHLTIHEDSAEHLNLYVDHEKFPDGYDVLATLPWSLFEVPMQEAILNNIVNAIKPGGKFICFSYVTAQLMTNGKHFEMRLRGKFTHVEVTPVIWKNFPPATVYICSA